MGQVGEESRFASSTWALNFALEVLAWDKFYGLGFWNSDRLFGFRIHASSGLSIYHLKGSKSDQLHDLILLHSDLNRMDNRCDGSFHFGLACLASELFLDRFNQAYFVHDNDAFAVGS